MQRIRRSHYTIGQTTYSEERILRALRNNNRPQNIHALSAALGENNIVGVSDAMVKLYDTTSALAGSGSTVHAARSDKFLLAVQRYQDSLLAYRDVTQGKGAVGATKASAGIAVRAAFEHMQKHFQRELSMTAGVQRASRKGTPLRNRTRALNIARSSRSIKKTGTGFHTPSWEIGPVQQIWQGVGHRRGGYRFRQPYW